MAYTHFWEQTRVLTQQEWAALCADTKALLAALPANSRSAGGFYAHAPLSLCHSLSCDRATQKVKPVGVPLVDAERIEFNGVGTQRVDFEGAGSFAREETLAGSLFRLARDPACYTSSHLVPRVSPYWNAFVATDRKPYDFAVCAVLLAARDAAPDALMITSHGRAADWEPARIFAVRALGRELVIPGVTEIYPILSAHERLEILTRRSAG